MDTINKFEIKVIRQLNKYPRKYHKKHEDCQKY